MPFGVFDFKLLDKNREALNTASQNKGP